MLLSIFTFTSGDITSIIGYIGEVFTDIKPLFFVIVGVSVGLWIISGIIRGLTARHER